MLKSTLKPHYNFKFSRESLSQDSSEQSKSLFTQEQFAKVQNYIQENPDKVEKLLSQDTSNYTDKQRKQIELIQAASQNSSYENFLQTNIKTQESANNYYSQTQEAMSPREMDMTKVAEKMGRDIK